MKNPLEFLRGLVSKNIVLILASLLATLGCTRNEGKSSKITIIAPKSTTVSESVGVSMSVDLSQIEDDDGIPWSGEIVSSSEVNCYLVFVGGVGIDKGMRQHHCNDKDSGAELLRFGYFAGGVLVGLRPIRMTMPVEPGLVFTGVVGEFLVSSKLIQLL